MTRPCQLRLAALVLALANLAAVAAISGSESEAAASDTQIQRATDRHRPRSCTATSGDTTEIATAKLTSSSTPANGDLGVHGQFDDTGWSELCVFDPSGRQILAINPHRQLRDLTMASLFFESREPTLDEFGFADLARQFPEGDYRVAEASFDGTQLVGTAVFTHHVPAQPVITSPEVAEPHGGFAHRVPRAQPSVISGSARLGAGASAADRGP
ncbi:MAG: hypothetical protein OEM97_02625 [Acidimicrobiia bacterium]|nr:hypothetical protein [Acidimicrobiia bacterium]